LKDLRGVAGNHQVEGQIEVHKPRASCEYVVRGPGIYDRGCATHLVQDKNAEKYIKASLCRYPVYCNPFIHGPTMFAFERA
jgi:hypothetical protein